MIIVGHLRRWMGCYNSNWQKPKAGVKKNIWKLNGKQGLIVIIFMINHYFYIEVYHMM